MAGCGPEVDFSNLFGPRAPYRPPWELPSSPQRLIRGVPYETEVTFTDLEGKYDVGLTADLSGLPSGSLASFTEEPTPQHARTRRGWFRWTPTEGDRVVYVVGFIGRKGSSIERKDIRFYTAAPGADVAPLLSAPDTIWIAVGDTVTFSVSAIDPNDEPILNWEIGSRNPNDASHFYYAYVPRDPRSIEPSREIRLAAIREGSYGMALHLIAWNSLGSLAVVQVRVRTPT